jgi:hypothetical protein
MFGFSRITQFSLTEAFRGSKSVLSHFEGCFWFFGFGWMAAWFGFRKFFLENKFDVVASGPSGFRLSGVGNKKGETVQIVEVVPSNLVVYRFTLTMISLVCLAALQIVHMICFGSWNSEIFAVTTGLMDHHWNPYQGKT